MSIYICRRNQFHGQSDSKLEPRVLLAASVFDDSPSNESVAQAGAEQPAVTPSAGNTTTPEQHSAAQRAGNRALDELEALASTDEGFSSLSMAISGNTTDNSQSGERFRKLLDDAGQRVKFSSAVTGDVNDAKLGDNVLPQGVAGAFVAGKDGQPSRILLAAELEGNAVQGTAREEVGELAGDLARKAGIEIAAGDVGSRVAQVLSGSQAFTLLSNPKAFQSDASDTAQVRADGQVVNASAKRVLARNHPRVKEIRKILNGAARIARSTPKARVVGLKEQQTRVFSRATAKFKQYAESFRGRAGKLDAYELSVFRNMAEQVRLAAVRLGRDMSPTQKGFVGTSEKIRNQRSFIHRHLEAGMKVINKLTKGRFPHQRSAIANRVFPAVGTFYGITANNFRTRPSLRKVMPETTKAYFAKPGSLNLPAKKTKPAKSKIANQPEPAKPSRQGGGGATSVQWVGGARLREGRFTEEMWNHHPLSALKGYRYTTATTYDTPEQALNFGRAYVRTVFIPPVNQGIANMEANGTINTLEADWARAENQLIGKFGGWEVEAEFTRINGIRRYRAVIRFYAREVNVPENYKLATTDPKRKPKFTIPVSDNVDPGSESKSDPVPEAEAEAPPSSRPPTPQNGELNFSPDDGVSWRDYKKYFEQRYNSIGVTVTRHGTTMRDAIEITSKSPTGKEILLDQKKSGDREKFSRQTKFVRLVNGKMPDIRVENETRGSRVTLFGTSNILVSPDGKGHHYVKPVRSAKGKIRVVKTFRSNGGLFYTFTDGGGRAREHFTVKLALAKV